LKSENTMSRSEDDRLDALLSTVKAEPEAWMMTRVRARLVAEEPRWAAWLMRPAALATSAALLVVALGGTLLVLQTTEPATEVASLTDALLTEHGAVTASELGASSAGAEAASDSGSLQ
jgi:hypothetical protein